MKALDCTLTCLCFGSSMPIFSATESNRAVLSRSNFSISPVSSLIVLVLSSCAARNFTTFSNIDLTTRSTSSTFLETWKEAAHSTYLEQNLSMWLNDYRYFTLARPGLVSVKWPKFIHKIGSDYKTMVL